MDPDQIYLKPILLKEKAKLEEMLLPYFKETNASHLKTSSGIDKILYPYLDLYWTEENRFALMILWRNESVGFALVNDFVRCHDFGAQWSIAEFYISPEYRRRGIGKIATHKIFNQWRGKWEIRQKKK